MTHLLDDIACTGARFLKVAPWQRPSKTEALSKSERDVAVLDV